MQIIPLYPPQGGQNIQTILTNIKQNPRISFCASAGILVCALPPMRICPFGDLVALIILRGGWFAVQDIISGFLCFCGGFEN